MAVRRGTLAATIFGKFLFVQWAFGRRYGCPAEDTACTFWSRESRILAWDWCWLMSADAVRAERASVGARAIECTFPRTNSHPPRRHGPPFANCAAADHVPRIKPEHALGIAPLASPLATSDWESQVIFEGREVGIDPLRRHVRQRCR
jgi:hypothetical protein